MPISFERDETVAVPVAGLAPDPFVPPAREKRECPVVVEHRLAMTGDGTRLVKDTHPDAAILYAIPGQRIAAEMAALIDLGETELVEPTEHEPEQTPDVPAQAEKRRGRPRKS